MKTVAWIRCPLCGNKTRLKIREDTELKNFPLFCPKCKLETIINVSKYKTVTFGNVDVRIERKKTVLETYHKALQLRKHDTGKEKGSKEAVTKEKKT